jgi:NADPH:quinone reductase-like Zn-dependent oxidoreductase
VRAVVYDRYGPPEVLRIEEVEPPVPQEDEVLVRVHATTVNQTDCHMRRARPLFWRFLLGFLRPEQRILGTDLAGVVEAVGADVTTFAVGDRVFGARPFSPKTARHLPGTHAELVCIREKGVLAHMPADMSFEEAAAVYDGAYQGLTHLRRAKVGEGTRLVVYGASGSCGTAAVQLAKHFGAHVTAVCNTKNVEVVRSLGADEVVDYTREDFTKNGETYDVVLDAVGKYSFFRCRSSLRPGGLYAATDRLHNLLLAMWTSRIGDRRVVFGSPRHTKADLLFFKELLQTGEYRAVIDRTYPFEDVVEAHRYVDSWQKTGNVVLTLNGGPSR